MDDVEKTMLIVAAGFAANHSCNSLNIQSAFNALFQKRKKGHTKKEKEMLLRIFELAKDKGLYQFFSNSDIEILEYEIKNDL